MRSHFRDASPSVMRGDAAVSQRTSTVLHVCLSSIGRIYGQGQGAGMRNAQRAVNDGRTSARLRKSNVYNGQLYTCTRTLIPGAFVLVIIPRVLCLRLAYPRRGLAKPPPLPCAPTGGREIRKTIELRSLTLNLGAFCLRNQTCAVVMQKSEI